MARVLVAGIGNVFLGDDGFGPEVARRLAAQRLPDGVEVADVGIAGLHLAYRLLEPYTLVIAIDACRRGDAPGTLYLLEPSRDERAVTPDAHSIHLPSVLAMTRALGGEPSRVLVLGCEPESFEGMGLSPAVNAAIEPAIRRVRQLARGVDHESQS